jgi:hypothetical protein
VRKTLTRTRRLLFLSHVMLWLGMAALVIVNGQAQDGSLFGVPGAIVQPISGVAVLGGAVVWLRKWRCPRCRTHLGSLFERLRLCRHCGVPLR